MLAQLIKLLNPKVKDNISQREKKEKKKRKEKRKKRDNKEKKKIKFVGG